MADPNDKAPESAPGKYYVDGTCIAAQFCVAVATDFNPGSAPSFHLPLAMTLACINQRMTPEEALRGVTCHGARALGLADTHGTLAVGKAADLAVWEIERPAELVYRIGFNPLAFALKDGRRRPRDV